jgi:hypothetical protein
MKAEGGRRKDEIRRTKGCGKVSGQGATVKVGAEELQSGRAAERQSGSRLVVGLGSGLSSEALGFWVLGLWKSFGCGLSRNGLQILFGTLDDKELRSSNLQST